MPAAASPIAFVCPACRGQLARGPAGYACPRCAREYPVVCGIPDFRLVPDRYIALEDDRRKAERLYEAGAHRTFEQLLRYYYSVTPEDPGDLAERWIAHAQSEVAIASTLLAGMPVSPTPTIPLLDVGCSTGGLLIAAGGRRPTVGVDVALRWLAVGLVRLREAGVEATLICANAEHLPFRDASFGAITCVDTLEHVTDARRALAEAHRVSLDAAPLLCTANNRLSPLPEPNIHLWGVGYLPREWQPAYVRWRRKDLHPYGIRLLTAAELRGIAVAAGYRDVSVVPAPATAPHARKAVRRLVRTYEWLRRLRLSAWLLKVAGPRLLLTAVARPSTATGPSAAGPADT